MNILVTGAKGFIARNLICKLEEIGAHTIFKYHHDDDRQVLVDAIRQVDFVFHLAGVNRPINLDEFTVGNVDLTALVVDLVETSKRKISIVYTSSIQAENGSDYGNSKLEAEDVLRSFAERTQNNVMIYRLPNVFGKWSRPYYNSAVATFCHQVATGKPISINNSSSALSLVYIDDVVNSFLSRLTDEVVTGSFDVSPTYVTTVGEVADQIQAFATCRSNLIVEKVGSGLARALYSTYLSFLPSDQFSYPIENHSDARGSFVEMLKTKDSGQISYFCAYPGVTRGEHYHHTKTEKFLVVAGQALFEFRDIQTNELVTLTVSGESPTIVDTIPGWDHNIKNIGSDTLHVLLWANENFNRELPDTIHCKVTDE